MKLVELLNTLDRWIDETPPVNQPSRFGNKAFRTWYAKLDQVCMRLGDNLLGSGPKRVASPAGSIACNADGKTAILTLCLGSQQIDPPIC